MRVVDSLLMELEQEGVTTRKVLERVPDDKLGWRPHPKSMSLGELALHLARTPGQVCLLIGQSEVELPNFGPLPIPASTSDVLKVHDESLATAKRTLGAMDDAAAMSTWTLKKDGAELMSLPKIGVVRAIMMNHAYHHRGQLSVYLRLLDVPVPSIYGPSADDKPF